MPILADSSCIRCGKTRIVKRVWKEKLEYGSIITHTETVCPDQACQKQVDEKFALARERREQLEHKIAPKAT
ncbi:hypothetical protein HYW40_00410 [Candidatus Curtissbacteria bacterium]|nr:hypothetical protein [Candidatus Curtissbacteria bacterium]